VLVRKDMDVNEHDKLSNFTAISKQNKDTALVLLF
jgi:hypothetical protein